MPLYEYQCQTCSHRFERIQKFSDPIEDVCPSCGGKVEKLVSSPAIQFKGSGWYITDYAKKSSSDGSSGKSSENAGNASAEKKSDGSAATTSSSSSDSSASAASSTPSTTSTSKE